MTSHSNTPIWEGTRAAAYTPIAGEHHADTVVVGLGGSGLTAVHALLDARVRVVGIDAGPVADGAAGRNGGLLLAGLAPFYHDAVRELGRDRARAIYRATMDEQDRIEHATPSRVRRTQSLRIEDSQAGRDDCAQQMDAMRADELPVASHNGPEGAGLRFPTDLTFDPLGRCRDLAAAAVERGATLFEHSAAVEIAGDRVTTERGTVRCDRVIVAVDGGLDRVLPELAPRVRTARLQMLGTAPAQDVALPIPMYLRDGYEYVQQLADGRLALGGFRDHFVNDEWTHDGTPTAAVQERIETFLRDRVGSSAEIEHRWAASVGYVDGALPIVEEARPGVWAIGGYSGTGNLIGALAGRAAAGLCRGQPTLEGELLAATS